MEIGDKYEEFSQYLRDFDARVKNQVINAYAGMLRATVELAYLQMLKSAGWEGLGLVDWHDYRKESGQWGGCFYDLTETGLAKVETLVGLEAYRLSGINQDTINILFASASIDQAIEVAEKRLAEARNECSQIKEHHGVNQGFDFWLTQSPEELRPFLTIN